MHPVTIMLIFLFAVLPAYCISKEISIEPLICPLHAPKLVFDLSNRGHCILPAKSSSNYTYFSTTIRMYKNNIGKYESEAYRCYKIKTRVGTYTQFARWNVFTKEEVEHVPVDEAECRSMVVDKKCQEGQLVENNGIYSTSNRANAIWSDGNIWNCCKYVRTCFFTLTIRTVKEACNFLRQLCLKIIQKQKEKFSNTHAANCCATYRRRIRL